MGQEVFCLIADNLAAVEQATKVCERRIMERREKILSIGCPEGAGSFVVQCNNDHRRTQMITEPKIEDRNEQPYVGIRTQVTMQEIGKVLPPLWGEVYGWLASKGLKPAGAPLWRYRVIDMAAKMEIDVGVPVATAVTGDNRITADILPAGRYATLIYTGPYEGLMPATGDLLDWAENKGIVWDKWPAGPKGEGWRARIENYLTDPTKEANPAKWETELAFKLADDQPR
jgi:effector-binding domain-containing protein